MIEWFLLHPWLTFIIVILFILILEESIANICRTVAYRKLLDKLTELQLKEMSNGKSIKQVLDETEYKYKEILK